MTRIAAGLLLASFAGVSLSAQGAVPAIAVPKATIFPGVTNPKVTPANIKAAICTVWMDGDNSATYELASARRWRGNTRWAGKAQ